jgi:hypothetical protein
MAEISPADGLATMMPHARCQNWLELPRGSRLFQDVAHRIRTDLTKLSTLLNGAQPSERPRRQ